jgi:ketosteroid isomerase-like protein
VAAPGAAALLARVVLLLPGPLRRRALQSAFERAREAFNRGDMEAVTALFDDDVEYVPPPPLGGGEIRGRRAVLDYWAGVLARYPQSTIENLSIREAERGRFVRGARLRHRGAGEEPLDYEILQTTILRGGRVVRQVNEAA